MIKKLQLRFTEFWATKKSVMWFTLVGLFSATIYVSVSELLITLLYFNWQVGTAFGLILSAFTSYIGHFYLTFRSTGRHLHHSFRYIGQLILMFSLNILIVEIFSRCTTFPLWIATSFVAITFPLINYFIYRGFTFKDKLGIKEYLP